VSELLIGGVEASRIPPALRVLEPRALASWVYDLDALDQRIRRFRTAFSAIDPLIAFALKANALPAILERVRAAGLGADAGSIGELEIAKRAGFDSARRVLNGNGRTAEEAIWAIREGVAVVNADSIDELRLLNAHAWQAGRVVRVALRVNPGIETPGHRYVATGGEDAKFGIAPDEALEAWAARSRWENLQLDGLHIHVGSQVVDVAPLERALDTALELAAESARRGAPLKLINLGGGFGVDYGGGSEFPLEVWAAKLSSRTRETQFEWVLEPGRWIAAPIGVLLAEVLAVKERGGRRFVVIAAGMNDLLRPALYHARHRIVPVLALEGAVTPATVVGPVCESADVFSTEVELPPLEEGDVVALLDVGAYGAAMSSNYNGRGRLAEVVVSGGKVTRARAGETPEDLAIRVSADELRVEGGWYFSDHLTAIDAGPIELSDLAGRIRSGDLPDDVFISRDGENWDNAYKFAEMLTALPLDRERIIREYLEYGEAELGKVDPGWAWERMQEILESAPEVAWEIVAELIERAPSEDALGYFAAGPLEDLLSDHGPLFIDRIESLAKRQPKLVRALRGVYRMRTTDDVWNRVQRLTKGEEP